MKNVWFLENVNLFNLLCPHRIKAYKKEHSFEQYNKNDFVYLDQDQADKVYLIIKGKVKISSYTEDGEEIVKAILTKGEVFGELAALGESHRNDYAQAVAATTICAVDTQTLQTLLKNQQEFSLNIYKLVGWRIKKLEHRLSLLMFKDARTRLIEFLKNLGSEQGEAKGNTIEINHLLTQKDIADLIGVSRPTLNSLLNELKSEGMVDFQRKVIRLYKNKLELLAS
ncbi:Crp/Fnr family transcriptional regulator [Microscilla marina]|nr:Crp/Fnr family transcriptional regulator [Microscilla marina]